MVVLKLGNTRYILDHYRSISLGEGGGKWSIRIHPVVPTVNETVIAKGEEKQMKQLMALIDKSISQGDFLINLDRQKVAAAALVLEQRQQEEGEKVDVAPSRPNRKKKEKE